MIEHSVSQIVTPSHVSLFAQTWKPAGGAWQEAVLIVHGFAEHSGRYQEVASYLAEQGCFVRAYDLRGHGRSQGRRAYIRRFDAYIADLKHVMAETKRDAGQPEIVLLGHSMGALIVLRYLRDSYAGVSGAVLSSPFLGIAAKVPGWKMALGKVMSAVWPGLPMANEIDSSYISRSPDEAKAYADDALMLRVATPRWLTETTAAQAEVLQLTNIDVPIFFMIAGGDRLVDAKLSQAFAHRVRCVDKQMKVYLQAYHELFHDTCKAEALSDLAAWLKDPHKVRKP